MTSIRKIESNKNNASRSTGPRTPGGKLRSCQNARRHGLATRIEDDPEAKGGIECLTAILAEGSVDFERIEQSRVLAERRFDLRRIRAARFDIFTTISDLENASFDDFDKALRAMGSISRYERRAFSKNKRALRKSLGD
jgi:hypothetical protein